MEWGLDISENLAIAFFFVCFFLTGGGGGGGVLSGGGGKVLEKIEINSLKFEETKFGDDISIYAFFTSAKSK